MKHFAVTLILEASREEIGPRRFVLHDSHFRAGYDLGLFLFYGPLTPSKGYQAIARSESSQTLAHFLEEDPLLANHLASVEVREFLPVAFPESLRGWIHPLGFCEGLNNGGYPAAYI